MEMPKEWDKFVPNHTNNEGHHIKLDHDLYFTLM